MSDRMFSYDEVTAAFRYASHWWRSLVGAVEDGVWDRPALGEWSTRELVAHTNRAYRTIVEYVEGEAKDPTPITSAAEYFRIVLAEETPHVHIAERARREAGEYGDRDVVAVTEDFARSAMRLVETAAGETVMHLFVGEMALQQYLATRVVELVVHGLDLAKALALPTDAPSESAKVALAVFVDLSEPADLSSVTRLFTGRPVSLPLRNVLG